MADIKYFDVIQKPIVTEKSMNAMAVSYKHLDVYKRQTINRFATITHA